MKTADETNNNEKLQSLIEKLKREECYDDRDIEMAIRNYFSKQR